MGGPAARPVPHARPPDARGSTQVDGIKVFSWSGSAALGGFLIDRMSFQVRSSPRSPARPTDGTLFQSTFFVTAMIKLAAVVPLFGLWRLVGTNKDLTRAESESRLRLLEDATEEELRLLQEEEEEGRGGGRP